RAQPGRRSRRRRAPRGGVPHRAGPRAVARAARRGAVPLAGRRPLHRRHRRRADGRGRRVPDRDRVERRPVHVAPRRPRALGGVYASGVVTWTVGTLGAGAGGSVTVTATLPSSGAFVDAATAIFSLSGVAGSAAAYPARTVYTPPALALTVTAPATTAVASIT